MQYPQTIHAVRHDNAAIVDHNRDRSPIQPFNRNLHTMSALVILAQAESLQPPAEASASLSPAEQARLDRISAPRRRAEFINGHWLLRILLAHHLGGRPGDFVLQQGEAAAPHLPARPDLRLGLSHSQGWLAAALLSASPDQKIGVDIELERPRKNLQALARYSFGEAWPDAQGNHMLPAFFRRWTQCEALVKGSQHSLGTWLLRNVRFEPASPEAGELHIQHTRLCLNRAIVHLSLCSPAGTAPQLLRWQAGELTAVTAEFAGYVVTVCPGT